MFCLKVAVDLDGLPRDIAVGRPDHLMRHRDLALVVDFLDLRFKRRYRASSSGRWPSAWAALTPGGGLAA